MEEFSQQCANFHVERLTDSAEVLQHHQDPGLTAVKYTMHVTRIYLIILHETKIISIQYNHIWLHILLKTAIDLKKQQE